MSISLILSVGLFNFEAYTVDIDTKNYFPMFRDVAILGDTVVMQGELFAPDYDKFLKNKSVHASCKLDKEKKHAICNTTILNKPYHTKPAGLCSFVEKLPVIAADRKNRLPLHDDGGFPSYELLDSVNIFYRNGEMCHHDGKRHYYIKRVDEIIIDVCTLDTTEQGATVQGQKEQCTNFAKDRFFSFDYNSNILTDDFMPVMFYMAELVDQSVFYKLVIPVKN
jgi:hypothetical protein